MKKVLIVLAVIIVAAGVFIGISLGRYSSVQKLLKPVETGKITDNIYAVKTGMVNFFIITDTTNYIAIDCGYNDKEANAGIRSLDMFPKSIQAIFLTHSDFDHTGSLKLYKYADLFLPEAEEQMVNGKKARSFIFMHNKIDRKYDLIKDGDTQQFGSITIKAIATPGHTPGSTSYLVNNTYLFTGDTLRLVNGIATNFVELFNMDTAAERASISNIAKLSNITYLITSHSGYTTNFNEAMKNWK